MSLAESYSYNVDSDELFMHLSAALRNVESEKLRHALDAFNESNSDSTLRHLIAVLVDCDDKDSYTARIDGSNVLRPFLVRYLHSRPSKVTIKGIESDMVSSSIFFGKTPRAVSMKGLLLTALYCYFHGPDSHVDLLLNQVKDRILKAAKTAVAPAPHSAHAPVSRGSVGSAPVARTFVPNALPSRVRDVPSVQGRPTAPAPRAAPSQQSSLPEISEDWLRPFTHLYKDLTQKGTSAFEQAVNPDNQFERLKVGDHIIVCVREGFKIHKITVEITTIEKVSGNRYRFKISKVGP